MGLAEIATTVPGAGSTIERLKSQGASEQQIIAHLESIGDIPKGSVVPPTSGNITNSYIQSLQDRVKNFNYEKEQKKYADRLSEFNPPQRNYDVFDLATSLSQGLSAQKQTDQPNSIGGGFALGFNQASQEMKQRDAEYAKARREIGLQAARMAMENEQQAVDYLNKSLAELAATDADNEIKSYFITGDKPITIDGKVFGPGDQLNLTKAEAFKYRSIVTGGGPGGVKVPASGTQGMYMSRVEAERTIQNLGLSENMKSYEDAVKAITAPSDAQLGAPIIRAGQYVELVPLVKDGVVYEILNQGITGATPPYILARNARLKAIQKSKDKYADNLTNVLPSVDRAMISIMNGAETGPLTDITVNFKAGINQIFGVDDPNINALQDIRGISFFLAPKMRPVGSGSTSDMEFKAYQNAILSLEKGSFANYISLYAFDKMTRNSIRLNQLEEELLQDETITSQKVINTKLEELDLGVFEKLPKNIEKDDETAVLNWYKTLPAGTVIDNSDGVFSNVSPFIVVGWENRGQR